MNASEFAFKSYADEELSNFTDWTRLSPSDWICVLAETTFHSEVAGKVIDALCQQYAPSSIGAEQIVFYYNESTHLQAVVREIDDLGAGEQYGCVCDRGSFAKRFLHMTKDGDSVFAGVFAAYDEEHKLIALSVSIERCDRPC